MLHLQVPVPSIFSQATLFLTIVIPAYNEEKRLPKTLDETFRYVMGQALLCMLQTFLSLANTVSLLTSLVIKSPHKQPSTLAQEGDTTLLPHNVSW